MKDIVFPKNYVISEDVTLKKLHCKGEAWQIYSLQNDAQALIVTAELYEFWKKLGLIHKHHFCYFLYEDALYFYFVSDEEYELTATEKLHDFVTSVRGLSYAIALKETRKLIPHISLKNGIFAERISRILPLLNEIEHVSDEIILGTWLTGGLAVPATSFRRMLQVQPRINAEDLAKIVSAAGLDAKEGEETTGLSNPSDDKRQEKGTAEKKQKSFALPGRAELENFLIDNVIDIIEHPDEYAAMNITFPGAFILHGPPGCGKTYAVDQLVQHLDWPVFYVESGTLGSPYIHETSKKIAVLFKEAMENAPSVLVIDEMEAFLSTRSQSTDSSGHHKEEIAEFLRKIPEAVKNRVLIIGMTNMIDSIDPAIRRRGRFDHVIEVGMPSAEEIKHVLNSMLVELPHDEEVDTAAVAELLEGAPMSDVAFTIREAARLTAKNHLKSITQEILSSVAQKVAPLEKDNRRTIGFLNE